MKTKTAIWLSAGLVVAFAGFYFYNESEKKKAAAKAAQVKKVAAALGDSKTITNGLII